MNIINDKANFMSLFINDIIQNQKKINEKI